MQEPNGRLKLQKIFCEILGNDHAYFQPTENIKMEYPAIVYNLDDVWKLDADDGTYIAIRRYQVTVIHEDPDNEIIGKVAALPKCQYNRHYTQDQLNHDVFTLYF